MKDHSKQHRLWLLIAACTPAAHFSGGGWVAALVTSLVVLPLSLLPKSWGDLPKPLAVIEMLGFGVTAGMLLRTSPVYWPSDHDLVVPLTLLALSACAKTETAPRIGAVLAFCMAPLAAALAVKAVSTLEFAWLIPSVGRLSAGLALALLLVNLPAAEETEKGKGAAAIGVAAIATAALVQGILSPAAASDLSDPLYQSARTMGPLEPVAAVAMTLGWFATGSALIYSAAIVAGQNGLRTWMGRVLATLAALATVLLSKEAPGVEMAVIPAVLWIVVPFLNKIKKNRKIEK